MKVLPCKYVFKVKELKGKVRLVALGCLQMFGVNYNETFAPIVTIVTIRFIFAIAAALDLEIEQMDLVTAFLKGDLNENIYMGIPERLKNISNTDKGSKLSKSLMVSSNLYTCGISICTTSSSGSDSLVALTIHASIVGIELRHS